MERDKMFGIGKKTQPVSTPKLEMPPSATLTITEDHVKKLFLLALAEVAGVPVPAEKIYFGVFKRRLSAAWAESRVNVDYNQEEVARIIGNFLTQKIDQTGVSIQFKHGDNEYRLEGAEIAPKAVPVPKFAVELVKLIS